MSERERRRAPRKRAEIDVRYRVVGAPTRDPARDISTGGVFIACESPLPLGAEVEVFLDRPQGERLVVTAEVVRVVWGGRRAGEPVAPGMALRFRDLDDEARASLIAVVDGA